MLAELRAAAFPVPRFEVSPRDLFATMQRLGAPLAVRSCADVEDGATASFAGQFHTVLNVRTIDELEHAVAACRASGSTEAVRDYCRRHHVNAAVIHIAVIVQRMIEPVLSGVAFSVDPLTGDDRVTIEACEGLGEPLLAGERQPLAADHPLLERWRSEIERLARDVQRHFGCPQDIEFAIDSERLWLLQARPVTRIAFPSDVGQWTNADFRDGGVSATVCSPLMWSLYERAWRDALLGFLREIRLLGGGEAFEAGRLFFGRPYWNLGAVKRCLSRLPGYVERRFDADLNVEPAYEGDGEVTPVTLRRVLKALPTAWALRAFFKRQAADDRAFLADGFEAMMARHDGPAADPGAALRDMVTGVFAHTERAYFRTIFAASLAKLDFKDAFPDGDEATLVADLPPLRHLAPVRDMREMARSGRTDVAELLSRHRHHHPAGLDVIHPRWDEQRAYVERLAATIHSGGDASAGDRHRNAATARAEHLARLPRRRRAAFQRKLDRLRTFLYLREEMRDCSSRVYYLIRRCALAVAEQRGLGDDVFFMTVEQIVDDDRTNIRARRDVYDRFRRFDAPNEIGGRPAYASVDAAGAAGSGLPGLAAGRGRARGTARVARSADAASQLEPGVILVCPFIDPGWTCVLDRVAAVVTENGGLLSHAAVICREFNLPAVLGVRGATRRIRDGSTIEVDGDHGQVRLLDEQAERGAH